jgi:hypothetical protein
LESDPLAVRRIGWFDLSPAGLNEFLAFLGFRARLSQLDAPDIRVTPPHRIGQPAALAGEIQFSVITLGRKRQPPRGPRLRRCHPPKTGITKKITGDEEDFESVWSPDERVCQSIIETEPLGFSLRLQIFSKVEPIDAGPGSSISPDKYQSPATRRHLRVTVS